MYILAIILAALAWFVVGSLWYSQKVFGRIWMQASGFSFDTMDKSGMKKSMAVGFASALLIAWGLWYLFDITGALTVADALWLTGAAWLGYVLPTLLGAVAWEKKNWKVLWINAGGYLVSMFAAALVLSYWL